MSELRGFIRFFILRLNLNPTWQVFHYRVQLGKDTDAKYKIKCIVDGLSNAGSFMEWGGKHLIVEQQQDGTYTCQTSTEPGSLPKLSKKQSGD